MANILNQLAIARNPDAKPAKRQSNDAARLGFTDMLTR
jgi:hypothetical protein